MRFIIVLVGCIIIFSCEKDLIEPVDCAGVSGGSAKLDNCGRCDEDPQNDCVDCTSHFAFNQSFQQASYFFTAVLINGIEVEPNDWVGAFNGDVCVGARNWDTSFCNSGVCDVPVLGDDGTEYTTGYMMPGGITSFQIYDVSEGMIYNTKTTEEIVPWSNYNFQIISTLESTTAAPCQ